MLNDNDKLTLCVMATNIIIDDHKMSFEDLVRTMDVSASSMFKRILKLHASGTITVDACGRYDVTEVGVNAIAGQSVPPALPRATNLEQ